MPVFTTERIQAGFIRFNEVLVRKPWLFAIIMLGIYGTGHADYEPFAVFVANPFALSLPASLDNLYSSPLNMLIGAVFAPITGAALAFALLILISLIALFSAWGFYLTNLSSDMRTSVAFVVLSTPILLVIPEWLGKGDALLLAGYLTLLASRGRNVVTLLAGLVMVMAHREMGFIILAGHCFLRGTFPKAALTGACLGAFAIAVYHYGILPHPPISRSNVVLADALSVLRRNATTPIAHVVIGLGWFWMFAYQKLRDQDGWRSLVYIAFILCVAFIVIDFTRVLIILSAPVVLLTAERIAADPTRRNIPLAFPFPMLFLIQAQFIECNQFVDTVLGQRIAG